MSEQPRKAEGTINPHWNYEAANDLVQLLVRRSQAEILAVADLLPEQEWHAAIRSVVMLSLNRLADTMVERMSGKRPPSERKPRKRHVH